VRGGDLSTGDGIGPDLLRGVGTVFHCAGELRDAAAMRAVHVDGTARLLAAARQASTPPRWIQLSSVGAYGPPAPAHLARDIDERTPENPSGPYETTKTDSDRLVAAAGREGVIVPAWLRPANVVGRQMRSAAVTGLASALRRGVFFYVGAPGAIANYVHVEDVASALVACESPAAAGQVFNLSSDCAWEDLIARLAARLRVPVPRRRLPEVLVRGIVGTAGRVITLPLTAPRIDALVNRTRYPSAKIGSVLGFRLAFPMPEGIDTVLEP
jgi:nucleoside-diphosphate-sugar epimerase